MKKLLHFALFLGLIALCVLPLNAADWSVPESLCKTKEKREYYNQLGNALARVLSDDQMNALFQNLAQARSSEYRQVLRVNRMSSLLEALNEIDSAIQRYNWIFRLKPKELASLLHFYRWLDPKENSLVQGYINACIIRVYIYIYIYTYTAWLSTLSSTGVHAASPSSDG
jgi:hypothetical protein